MIPLCVRVESQEPFSKSSAAGGLKDLQPLNMVQSGTSGNTATEKWNRNYSKSAASACETAIAAADLGLSRLWRSTGGHLFPTGLRRWLRECRRSAALSELKVHH